MLLNKDGLDTGTGCDAQAQINFKVYDGLETKNQVSSGNKQDTVHVVHRCLPAPVKAMTDLRVL